jgi:hypothetical protein
MLNKVFLTLLFIAVLISAVYSQTSSMEDFKIDNPLEKYGVKIIPASDEEFGGTLYKYIGGRRELDALLEASKPLLFFISNRSEKEIVGYSLRWAFTRDDGEVKYGQGAYSSPGILLGYKARSQRMVGKTSLINPGEVRLTGYQSLAPDLAENVHKWTQNGGAEYKFSPEEMERFLTAVTMTMQQSLRGIKSVTLSIDAVVFNDGTFVGDNKTFFYESTEGMIKAHADFIKFVKDRQQAGKTPNDIWNEFTSDVQERVDYLPVNTPQEAYEQSYKIHFNQKKQDIQRRRAIVGDEVLIKDILTYEGGEIRPMHRVN